MVEFFSLCLFQLGYASHRLRTQDIASPVAADLIIYNCHYNWSFYRLSQRTLVFQVNLFEGNRGAYLLVDKAPQPGLSLNDAFPLIMTHLSTQGTQENHKLSGVYIMGNHHQLSLLVHHQGGDCIDPCSENRWSLSWDVPFARSFLLSTGR